MAKRLISPRTFYQILHAIADGQVGPAEQAFLRAISVTADQIDATKLQLALRHGNVELAFLAVNLNGQLEPAIRQSYTRILSKAFVQAGVAVESLAPAIASAMSFRFDIVNPEAVRWAQTEAATLVRQVSVDARANIRSIVMQGIRDGLTPDWMAKQIRAQIGLTTKQSQAVRNFERLLQENNPQALTRVLRDHRFDPTIKRAIESGEALSKAQIDRQVERYAGRMLRYRANTIAATETIKASSAGQDDAWRQATDEGYLDAAQTREIWLITPDEHTCSVCRAIPRMNPDGVPLGGMFQSPVGPVKMPGDPHVRCRCGKALIFNQGRGFQVPRYVQEMAA